ncbi:hypothetical protein [Kitasatospora griseola]|uniref:hypothetical protein n=1 Tax=Kitasatospora griseola TaxID=2064 RepID=UPI003804EAAA
MTAPTAHEAGGGCVFCAIAADLAPMDICSGTLVCETRDEAHNAAAQTRAHDDDPTPANNT